LPLASKVANELGVDAGKLEVRRLLMARSIFACLAT